MKIKGWQRIGLAVFAIWTLVAFVGFWDNFHTSARDVLQLGLRGCQMRYELAPKGDGLAAYERCQQETGQAFQRNWDDATREFWQLILFIILIPALIVWGLVSLAIITVFKVIQGAPVDTTSSSGRLTFALFCASAEFERDVIRERTIAGLAAARARGRQGGRLSAFTPSMIRRAQVAMASRDTSVSSLCEELGVSRTSLYRNVTATGELTEAGKRALAEKRKPRKKA